MKRFSFLLLILFTLSCSKVQEERFVRQSLYLEIDLNGRDRELAGAGSLNFKEITAPRIANEIMNPRVGVIVIAGIAADGSEAYYAYDLRCPYEANNNILIKGDPAKNGFAICPKCGSKYDMSTGIGYPTGDEGPSTYYLISYPVSRKSTNQWVVSNY